LATISSDIRCTVSGTDRGVDLVTIQSGMKGSLAAGSQA
jgi:hypothetical protein